MIGELAARAARATRGRKAKAMVVAALAAAGLVGATGSAQAYTAWPDVLLIPHNNTRQCLTHMESNTSFPTLETFYCHQGANYPFYEWRVVSGAPDTGYSNVQIQNKFSKRCLVALQSGWNHGWQAELKPCNHNDPGQIWALTHTGQGGGGWQFFNFASRRCLDAGASNLLFRREGCDPNNPYQTWNAPIQ
ncbi:ricin-type beta-trefoil lectin domain protein [Kitasatospora sp. NPDC048296]|uniref:ricin-type beta-trefoil lectin domain protein n=1 Tax=Kitasatospora sp. NPDC048296 TaxID=3364048 RepID=UPI0037144698